jgi:hypothetical protein
VARAAAVPLSAPWVIAISFRSWLLARRTMDHKYRVYHEHQLTSQTQFFNTLLTPARERIYGVRTSSRQAQPAHLGCKKDVVQRVFYERAGEREGRYFCVGSRHSKDCKRRHRGRRLHKDTVWRPRGSPNAARGSAKGRDAQGATDAVAASLASSSKQFKKPIPQSSKIHTKSISYLATLYSGEQRSTFFERDAVGRR